MSPDSDPERSTLYDNEAMYGWISILLHWSTAVIVIALWIVGKSILSASPDEIDARRALHVSVAGSAWLLVLFRIGWRFGTGHPRIRGQTDRIHRVARVNHYLMILLVLMMLLSGPLLVWADGRPIEIFEVIAIGSPIAESAAVREAAWTIHTSVSSVLAVLVLLHFCGAMKHLMFHTDDTIVRMLWPSRTR